MRRKPARDFPRLIVRQRLRARHGRRGKSLLGRLSQAAILAAVRCPLDHLAPQVGGNDHHPTRFANSSAPTAAEGATAAPPNQPTPRPRTAPRQLALPLYPACRATPSAVAEPPPAVVTARGHRVLRVRDEWLETYRIS